MRNLKDLRDTLMGLGFLAAILALIGYLGTQNGGPLTGPYLPLWF